MYAKYTCFIRNFFVFHRRIIAELAIFIAESGYFALQNRPKNIAEFRGVCKVPLFDHDDSCADTTTDFILIVGVLWIKSQCAVH